MLLWATVNASREGRELVPEFLDLLFLYFYLCLLLFNSVNENRRDAVTAEHAQLPLAAVYLLR